MWVTSRPFVWTPNQGTTVIWLLVILSPSIYKLAIYNFNRFMGISPSPPPLLRYQQQMDTIAACVL